MRITCWLLVAILTTTATQAAAPQAGTVDLAATPEVALSQPAPADPLRQREQILKALREDDLAALLTADGDETRLRDFLSEGADETPESIAARIAQASPDEPDERLARWWTTLAGADGVKRASAEIHPLWQAQLAQALGGAQMGLAAMGQAIAEDQDLSPVERAQLLELQFALTAWMARTDFGDRARFEQVLGHLRAFILASGKQHPLELALSTPQQRLELAARALRSGKEVLALYGIDAAAVLRSARVEKLGADAEHAHLRWSLSVLGVPLVFEEKLALHEGRWWPAGHVERMREYREQARAEEAEAEQAASEPAAASTRTDCTGEEQP